MLLAGETPRLSWAAASRSFPGEELCGDRALVSAFPGGVLVAVVDGLGHGPEAAEAAQAAVDSLALSPGDPVDALLRRCHQALARTRGAALSLLSLLDAGTLSWVGVGNVEVAVCPADRARPCQYLVLLGGVVGQKLPSVQPRSLQLQPGDLVAAATDGVRSDFASGLDRGGLPGPLAQQILEVSRPTDDALVWIGRVRAP